MPVRRPLGQGPGTLRNEAFNYLRVIVGNMATIQLGRELKLIRERLESIEEALSEEMTADDKRALREALREHKLNKTLPFPHSKKH